MSAFEDFIQQELPKRGYLNADVPQETVIIRRGLGPRQFEAVVLQEGQVLAFIGGQLVGTTLDALGGGVRRAIVNVATPNVEWLVQHNLNSVNVLVQAFDDVGYVIIPDSIQTVDANLVRITFNTPQAGVGRVLFLD